jgi:hypothetical protein
MDPSLTVVFVTGDRNWHDRAKIREILESHPSGTWVLHGGCRGADLIADGIARSLGQLPMRMDALWDFHGKRAGPIRNRAMAKVLAAFRKAGVGVHAYAFHDDLEHSKGTKDMTLALADQGIAWSRACSSDYWAQRLPA